MSLMNIVWTGARRTKYSTLMGPIGTKFDWTSGVYVLCKPHPTVAYTLAVVYVGETDDFDESLNTNLQNHPQWECIRKHGACQVCVMQVAGDRNKRLAIVADLKASLKPLCRDQ
jgi:hypothetical protein